MQKVREAGWKEFGQNDRALRDYNQHVNAQLRDYEAKKTEAINNDKIAVSEQITKARTLEGALYAASKALPENRKQMEGLAYSQMRDLNKTEMFVPDAQHHHIMGSARMEIFHGNVNKDLIDATYWKLPPKQRQELKKFADSVQNKDWESSTWDIVNRSMKTKNAGKKVPSATVDKMYDEVIAMHPNKIPSAKEVSDTIDLLRLDGEVIYTEDGTRGDEMTFQEARAQGLGKFWIPAVTGESDYDMIERARKQGIELDPEGEKDPYDAERTYLREQKYNLPALGTGTVEEAGARKRESMRESAQVMQQKTAAREKARLELGQRMAMSPEAALGMEEDLYRASEFGEMPEWMETALRNTGDFNLIEKQMTKAFSEGGGEGLKNFIVDFGNEMLDAADDRK